MLLYDYFRSSASYRVRIALALKGLEYRYVAVHLLKSEQLAAAYADLSPTRLVPLLKDDGGHLLTQSLAIVEYLEETHPHPPLLPADAMGRARVRALALDIGTGAVLSRWRARSQPTRQFVDYELVRH